MMNNTNRNIILKIFSVLAVICGFYPLIALFAFLNGYSIIFCTIAILYLIGISILATANCFLFRKIYRHKNSTAKIFYYIFAAILGIVTSFLTPTTNVIGKFFVFLAVTTLYILVTNFYYLHYSKLTNIFLFLGVCLINISVMLALSYMHSTQFQTGCILTFLFYSAVFGVTQNQANIDFMITRRNQSIDHLPKRIHRYNMKLFSILGIFLVIAFLVRKPLAKFLKYLCTTFLRGLFAIFDMLLNLFKGGETKLPPLETGIGEAPAEIPTQSGTGGDILFFIVMIFILVLVWLKRYEIIQSIKQFFNYIKLKISNFINGNSSPVSKQTFKDNVAYTDYVEEIEVSNRDFEHLSSDSKIKSWNKRYKAFLKMEPSNKSFRVGYSLLIEAISERGTEILPSDTPLDILKKFQNITLHVTSAYNNVRYGELNPTSLDYSTLCNILSNIKL